LGEIYTVFDVRMGKLEVGLIFGQDALENEGL